jgi:hypothetical protein
VTLPPLPYPAPIRPRKPLNAELLSKKDTLHKAILLAAEYVGDEMADTAAARGETRPDGLMGYLEMVARCDVKAFCGLLGRVLPTTLKGEGEGGAITVEIVKLASDGGLLVRNANPTA